MTKKITVEDVHNYWKDPFDGKNAPEYYAEGKEKSEYLVEIMKTCVEENQSILELGCNVGRNLMYLQNAGYKKLFGIEISEKAIEKMKEIFPLLNAEIAVNAIENELKLFPDKLFDCVFSLAVLEHIHHDNDSVFKEIARVTNGIIITIEAENHKSWRHFARNYKEIFEPFGFEQIEELSSEHIPELKTYKTRIFRRSNSKNNIKVV